MQFKTGPNFVIYINCVTQLIDAIVWRNCVTQFCDAIDWSILMGISIFWQSIVFTAMHPNCFQDCQVLQIKLSHKPM